MVQRVWRITSSCSTNLSSYHSSPSMASMKLEVWRPRWLSVPWLMPVEQDFMRVLPLGWTNPLPCPAMITWSSYQSRPRVTRRVRYSVSTTDSVMTLRSKGLSTVSLPVPPMVMITKGLWLLDSSYPVHCRLPLRLAKSSSPGLLRCQPDVSLD